jgi:rubrerythrin
MTLDETLGSFASCLTDERAKAFEAGDVIVAALREQRLQLAGQTVRRVAKARRTLLGQLAAAGHCSVKEVAERGAIAATFDREATKDVHWVVLRACLAAAQRTGREATAVLDEALANGWHCKEIGKLGAKVRAPTEEPAVCPTCGAEKRTEAA